MRYYQFPQLESERWRLRWSQREMARFLGLSHTTYARWTDIGVPVKGCAGQMCRFALRELGRYATPTFEDAVHQQSEAVGGDPFDEGLIRETGETPAEGR